MPDRKDPKSVLDGYYGDAADPYAEYPNPEAARAGSRVGIIEKLLGHLSGAPGGLRARSSAPSQSPEIARRTKEPWTDALANTTGSQSIANMVYDLAHGIKGAKDYKPGTQDYTAGQIGASLMNAPVLGGFTAAATKNIPKGALGSSFAEGPKIAPAMRERVIDPHTGTYSAVIEGAHGLDLKSGTPEQFINAVLKKPNVKPEELYWMGLADYAGPGKMVPSAYLREVAKDRPGGKIPKEVFAQVAEQRRIKPEKTVREGDGVDEEYSRERMGEDASNNADRHEIRPDPDGLEDQFTVEQDPDHPGKWRIIDDERAKDAEEVENGHHIVDSQLPSRAAAEDALTKHATQLAEDMGRYSVYDQNGNHVDGPFDSERRAERAMERANEAAWDHAYENLDPSDFGDPNGAKHLEHLGNRPGGEEAGQNYRENVYSVPQQTLAQRGLPDFLRSHYPENGNVFSHALVHDYTDAATNLPGTYLTEGQSDWRKALTKNGVAKSGPELAALEKAKAEAYAQRRALEEQYHDRPIRDPAAPNPVDALHQRDELWKQIQAQPEFPSDARLQDQRNWAYDHVPELATQWKAAYDQGYPFGAGDALVGNAVHKAPPDIVKKMDDAQRSANSTFREYEQARSRGDTAWMDRALSDYQRSQQYYNELVAAYPALDPEAVKTYQQQAADFNLRETEADNAYSQARHGVTPGPWVSEYNKSGWQSDKGAADRWMAKQLLWETANDPNSHWVGWPTPEVIADRWGDNPARGYKQDIPNSILKQAQLHDPEARIGEVHIGDYEPSNNPGRSYQIPHPEDTQPLLPFGESNGGLHIDRSLSRTAHIGRTPEGIVMEPRNPDMSMSYRRTGDDLSNMIPMYQLDNGQGHPVGAPPYRSHAAAEAALNDIRKMFETEPARPSLEDLQDKHDLTAQPAIRMTDKMRESIKKKGFPLFVNPPTTGGIAGFLSNPSPTTAGSVLDKAYPAPEDQQ